MRHLPALPRSPAIRTDDDRNRIIEATRLWIADVVIGLDLCPFARRVFHGGLIRYTVSDATDPEDLRSNLAEELEFLASVPATIETSFLIHPDALARFTDYCDFLSIAQSLIRSRGHRGVIQIASFHPDFQFAGVDESAVENYTNRSPFPMLHLLREQSVTAAVQANPSATNDIPKNNVAKLRSLGLNKILKITQPSRSLTIDGNAPKS